MSKMDEVVRVRVDEQIERMVRDKSDELGVKRSEIMRSAIFIGIDLIQSHADLYRNKSFYLGVQDES